MSFPGFDPARVCRALALLESRPGALLDAFFEHLEVISLGGETPALSRRSEEGFALRLARPEGTWMASCDGLDGALLESAYRRVARVLPATPPVLRGIRFDPAHDTADDAADDEELRRFPGKLQQALRARRAAFALEIRIARYRRRIQAIGPQLLAPPQSELFYALECRYPGGRYGALLPSLDGACETLARTLAERVRSRDAGPVDPGCRTVVLAPAAAAVLLHEVVAHTLEADTLALTGSPQAALGFQLGSTTLSVVDDPAGAPPTVCRSCDDEGTAVMRRWLLRDGRIEQPLADRLWAERCDGLQPGAGRRSHRHAEPVPRSTFLELLPGDSSPGDLLTDAADGLLIEELDRGQLDPMGGRFRVAAACARRIENGGIGARVGPLELHGAVNELLSSVTAVGRDAVAGGAGWCAKGGQRLPVWARAASLRLEGVRVVAA